MDERLRAWVRRQRLTIAKRELQVLSREKTIVLALAVQLFIAGFSGFLVVGLVSLYDPGSVDGYQIEAAVTGDAADEMAAAIDERDALSSTEYNSTTTAFADFDEGRVQAVFETSTREGQIDVVLTAPDGSIETTLVVAESQKALRALERNQRIDRAVDLSVVPLDLPADSGGNPYFDFTYTVLLPLLVFLPVFISGSIAVDSITEEVDRGTLELLRVAPVSLTQIVDGKALAMITIAPLQAMTWLTLLSLNGVSIANGGWLFTGHCLYSGRGFPCDRRLAVGRRPPVGTATVFDRDPTAVRGGFLPSGWPREYGCPVGDRQCKAVDVRGYRRLCRGGGRRRRWGSVARRACRPERTVGRCLVSATLREF